MDIWEFHSTAKHCPPHRRNRPGQIYSQGKMMQNNPNVKIDIQGHLCCQFTNRMKHVSTDRALAVYDFLVKNKIKSNRLKYKGYGVKKPIHPIPEKSPTQEAENRRVEIKILQN